MGYIVLQEGRVCLTEEGLLVREFSELAGLYVGDVEGFRACVRYIYFFADRYSPYINYIETDRVLRIRKEQFSYMSAEAYEGVVNSDLVLRCIEVYKSDTYDLIDRAWDGARIKVDNFLKHLNNIPMEVERVIKVEVDIGGGKRGVRDVSVVISNHEEYWKALKTYNEVLKFVKQVNEDTIRDKKEGSRKHIKRRLYDEESSLLRCSSKPARLLK